MPFSGFPPKVHYTPVPNPLFGQLLEEIDDLAELKCTLRVLWLVNQKKGLPRLVTLTELQEDRVLIRALTSQETNIEEAIANALEKAVKRGTLIQAMATLDGEERPVYLLNTEAERRSIEREDKMLLQKETLPQPEPWQVPKERPNIFSLYESNIGMLAPLIAEELKEAETLYPQEWIEDAFKEAVKRNKRSWRYISRILERWDQEGRDDGEHGEPWGHIKKTDPKRYLRL